MIYKVMMQRVNIAIIVSCALLCRSPEVSLPGCEDGQSHRGESVDSRSIAALGVPGGVLLATSLSQGVDIEAGGYRVASEVLVVKRAGEVAYRLKPEGEAGFLPGHRACPDIDGDGADDLVLVSASSSSVGATCELGMRSGANGKVLWSAAIGDCPHPNDVRVCLSREWVSNKIVVVTVPGRTAKFRGWALAYDATDGQVITRYVPADGARVLSMAACTSAPGAVSFCVVCQDMVGRYLVNCLLDERGNLQSEIMCRAPVDSWRFGDWLDSRRDHRRGVSEYVVGWMQWGGARGFAFGRVSSESGLDRPDDRVCIGGLPTSFGVLPDHDGDGVDDLALGFPSWPFHGVERAVGCLLLYGSEAGKHSKFVEAIPDEVFAIPFGYDFCCAPWSPGQGSSPLVVTAGWPGWIANKLVICDWPSYEAGPFVDWPE